MSGYPAGHQPLTTRVLNWLARRGHRGGTSDEAGIEFGRASMAMSCVLSELTKRHRVEFVPEPAGKANQRRRYFAPGFKPAVVPARPAPKRRKAAVVCASGPAICNVSPTVIPHHVDRRYVVEAVSEPLFSSLGIGRYLKRETAIAVAYGSKA